MAKLDRGGRAARRRLLLAEDRELQPAKLPPRALPAPSALHGTTASCCDRIINQLQPRGKKKGRQAVMGRG